MHDYFAYLGISLRAMDSEVERTYQRVVQLLHPNCFPPTDPRQLEINRLLTESILPAYSTLRAHAVRAYYLETYRAHLLATVSASSLGHDASVARLATATSQAQLSALYEQEVSRCSQMLFSELDAYDERVARLSRLNTAFVIYSQHHRDTTVPSRPSKDPRPPLKAEQPQAPTKIDQLLSTAETLLKGGQASKALKMLQRLQVPEEQLQRYYRLVGRCYQAMGMPSEAFAQFQMALAHEQSRTPGKRTPVSQAPVLPGEPEPPSRLKQVIDWLNQPL